MGQTAFAAGLQRARQVGNKQRGVKVAALFDVVAAHPLIATHQHAGHAPLAGLGNQPPPGLRVIVDVDERVGNAVLGQEVLEPPAVPAPVADVDLQRTIQLRPQFGKRVVHAGMIAAVARLAHVRNVPRMEPLVLTREQVREIDRRAIEEFGLPSFALMENAARACADEAQRLLRIHGVHREMTRLAQPGSRDDIPRNLQELERWKEGLARSDRPVLILCGPGNNGGDGLAMARTLVNRGHAVEVVVAGGADWPQHASPDVRLNLELLRRTGVSPRMTETGAQAQELAPLMADSVLIVDALFGSGATRPLTEPHRALVHLANEAPAIRIAVDIPSGLDADTGDILGVAFRADLTVTFIASKPGFMRKAGPASCGKIVVAEIGIPRSLIQAS